jgi:hypothetical protein
VRQLAVLVAALVCASAAAADAGHEPYLVGSVVSRVAGQNAAQVRLSWNFYCLAGTYGEGTYTYTVVLRRLQPKPVTTTPILRSSSRSGTHLVRLKPGQYRVDADPYHCEAGIGLSSSVPEQGLPFVVPDYCTFVADRLSGRVTAAGRRVNADARVRPGNVVAVAKGGSVVLVDEGETRVTLRGAASARLEKAACATTPGWRWTLRSGTLVAASPHAAAQYEVVAGGATIAGRGAEWTTTAQGGHVTVAVARGSVTVKARGTVRKLGRGRTLTL